MTLSLYEFKRFNAIEVNFCFRSVANSGLVS